MNKNDWIIIPKYHIQPLMHTPPPKKWVLYRMDRLVSQQDYARDEHGQVRQFTTRSGARGVRSRLRKETTTNA